MQAFFLYALALGAGVSVAVQQVLNGAMRIALTSPAWAGFVSYAGGLLDDDRGAARARRTRAVIEGDREYAVVGWSGGVLGGIFILLMIVLLPSLGATTLIALVVAGQMAAAITLDHFGAFGLTPHPISISRLFGRCSVDCRRCPDQGLIADAATPVASVSGQPSAAGCACRPARWLPVRRPVRCRCRKNRCRPHGRRTPGSRLSPAYAPG